MTRDDAYKQAVEHLNNNPGITDAIICCWRFPVARDGWQWHAAGTPQYNNIITTGRVYDGYNGDTVPVKGVERLSRFGTMAKVVIPN